jgi:hypothetical protein
MSTIRVDNFGPSAGGTTYSARGIAKAWVNFNGDGTIAARDSENVSSLTDGGTGYYIVNFSNAFGAGDYATSGDSERYQERVFGYNASNLSIDTREANGSLTDSSIVSTISFGDLA